MTKAKAVSEWGHKLQELIEARKEEDRQYRERNRRAAIEEQFMHDDAAEEIAWANSIDIEQLEEWDADGAYEAYDGCRVDPDGSCEHGYRSPLLILFF